VYHYLNARVGAPPEFETAFETLIQSNYRANATTEVHNGPDKEPESDEDEFVDAKESLERL
jgi:hypothetical protein